MPFSTIDDPKKLRELLDAVLLLESDLDLHTTLYRIIEAACSLVDARYGALGVLGPDKRLSDFITVGLDHEQIQRIGNLPEGHGILGVLITDARPLRLADLHAHPDSYGFPPGHPPMTSFLGVPVRVRDDVFGNLYLTDKHGAPEFSAEDEQLVMALAVAAGIAIENARLHGRVRDLTLLEDRERIARDLHDTVIQRLFATGLSLQSVARSPDRDKVKARIESAVDDLDETIRQIRTTIFALESAPEHGGLRDAVLSVADDVRRPLGFAPNVRFDGPVEAMVSPTVAEHLLATLREALSNVARHAGATSVDVNVEVASGHVVLRVSDNGKGVDPAAARQGGRGLVNMAQRATALGGTLGVERSKAGGAEVMWRVPLDAGR